MKRSLAPLVIPAAVLAILPFASVSASGQAAASQTKAGKAAKAGSTQPIRRTSDGKPDISGVWAGPGFAFKEGAKYPSTPSITGFDPKLAAPFKPGGEMIFNLQKNGEVYHDDPQLHCLPHGIPRVILSARAQQYFQPPGYLVIVYEDDHMPRIIPLDGRPHPKDLELSWMGHSVGHWDGDTMVVDTVGLKAWSIDARDHMHSDALHVIERYTPTGPTTETVEITLDDPTIFTKPWSQSWGMHLHKDWEILEDICEENNKDPQLIEYLKK